MVVGAAAVAACTHPNPSFSGSFFPRLALAGPQKGSLYVKIFSSNVLQTEAWQPVSSCGVSDPVSVGACDSLVVWCRGVGEPQAVEAARCCTPEHKGHVGQGLRSLGQLSLWGD